MGSKVSDTLNQNDWSKSAAMAIPEGGYLKDKVEQGRYGPIFPKTSSVENKGRNGVLVSCPRLMGPRSNIQLFARSLDSSHASCI